MAAKQTPGMVGQKATRDERRAEAREKARLLQIQEEKRAKRNRFLLIGGVLVALALVVLAIVKIVSSGSNDYGSYDGTARPAKLANVSADYGIAVNANGAAVAQADTALPKLEIFADSMCVHCANLDVTARADLSKVVADGKLQLVRYPVAILSPEFSANGAAALFYIATYAPEQFNAFHDALFDRSSEILLARTAAQPTLGEIADIAKKVGVQAEVVNDLPASIAAADWKAVVEKATIAFRDAGHTGTPTVLANGKATTRYAELGIPAFLEEVIAGKEASATETETDTTE